jgi:hypothetical protein
MIEQTGLERKLEEHVVLVDAAGPDDDRREVGVVHGVGEPLRLQAQRTVLPVHLAAPSLDVVDEVARVELHARLVRPQLHRPARLAVPDHRHLPQRARLAVHDVVRVVAVDPGLAAVDLADVRAHGRRGPEVVGRAGHRRHLPRRDERGVHGRVPRREELDGVVEHVAAAGAAKVPVRVLGQVHRRRLVQCRRVHVHAQDVRTRDMVRHVHVQVAGEPCFRHTQRYVLLHFTLCK